MTCSTWTARWLDCSNESHLHIYPCKGTPNSLLSYVILFIKHKRSAETLLTLHWRAARLSNFGCKVWLPADSMMSYLRLYRCILLLNYCPSMSPCYESKLTCYPVYNTHSVASAPPHSRIVNSIICPYFFAMCFMLKWYMYILKKAVKLKPRLLIPRKGLF